MDTTLWLTDTCKVVKQGSGIGVCLKKNIRNGLDIKLGDLIEVKFRNTGLTCEKRKIKNESSEPVEPE